MDDTQYRLVMAELKESNKLMKAMVGELSQIKFEMVNERMRREVVKNPGTYTIPIPERLPEPDKEHALDVMK